MSNNAGSVGRTPSSGLHSLPSDQIHLSELRYVCDQNGEPIVLGKGAYGKVGAPSVPGGEVTLNHKIYTLNTKP